MHTSTQKYSNAVRSAGAHRSVWMQESVAIEEPELVTDRTTEICVVGAGIAGLTTAYLLSLSGHQVTVLDDGIIGSGESGRTTAHLTNALDNRYLELEKLHGTEFAKLAGQSHTDAINLIQRIIHTERIKCDFIRLDGYLFLDPEHNTEYLHQEFTAARRCGLKNLQMQSQGPDDQFKIGDNICFPQQGQFHILKYLNGLAAAITKRGGHIHTHTRVESFEQDDLEVTLHTALGYTVTCSQAVMATNVPIQCPLRIYSGQICCRTYVIGLRIAKDALQKHLYWDTAKPYHYVRIVPGAVDDWLIVGGEDHRTGEVVDIENRYQRLETWARRFCPSAGKVAYRWSGLVMEPADGLAIIGAYPHHKRVFMITGDSGMGMTHSTIGAQLITDLIHEKHNPLATVYSPSRIITKPLGEVIDENLQTVTHFVKDKLASSPVTSMAEIPNNSGAILGDGPDKQAVYRDGTGGLHRYSAKCPHKGCIVSWNDDEKTWDCPCHSSSFDRFGKMNHGPATTDLEELTD